MSWREEFRDFMSSVVSFPGDFFGGFSLPPSESGAIVNEFSAMQIAAYFGCIRCISDPVGSIPLNVYERKADGSEVVAYDHPLYSVLHSQPNPEATAVDVRQTMQGHVLTTGNAYAEIIRNNGGQPAALYVRSPFATFPYRRQTGELIYKVHDDPSGAERIVDAANMLHIKGFGIDSLVGLSPVKYYAREVLGVEIAAQAYSAKFFANNATPGGYLQSPSANLKPAQKLSALNSWMQAHSKGNSHMPAVLEAGWKWETTAINPEDAQLMQLRGMDRAQFSSIFGVPEHMIGGPDPGKSTAEQKALEFLTFTLKYWFRKWENSINSKLFPTVGRNANRFFAKFDTTELERADYKTMLQGLQMARYAGLVTAQEGRKQLGLNPYEQKQLTSKNPADRLLQPVNMVFVDAAILDDAQEVPPAPGSDTASEAENPVTPASDKAKGTSVTEKNSIKPYVLRYSGLFLDAFQRIQARKSPNERDFQRTFSPVLTSIAASIAFDPTSEEPGHAAISADLAAFVRDYVAGMAFRATEWKNDVATASAELKRAITAIHGKAAPAIAVFESEATDEQ